MAEEKVTNETEESQGLFSAIEKGEKSALCLIVSIQ